jgi:competence protein ComGC
MNRCDRGPVAVRKMRMAGRKLALRAEFGKDTLHLGMKAQPSIPSSGNREPAFRFFQHRNFTSPDRAEGFSRVELLAVLGVLFLLTLLTVPLLAATKPRSEQIVCLNNLRRIGAAFQLWGSDHDDRRPWRVPQAEGGTFPESFNKVGLGWLEFATISNELVTAKVLVCPSDEETKKVARKFTGERDGGFLNPSYRANALSYLLHMDTYSERPHSLLSGDRHLRVDATGVGCSSRINNAAAVLLGGAAQWTNAIHWPTGNLLFDDGQVQTFPNDHLPEVLDSSDDNQVVHLLMPK